PPPVFDHLPRLTMSEFPGFTRTLDQLSVESRVKIHDPSAPCRPVQSPAPATYSVEPSLLKSMSMMTLPVNSAAPMVVHVAPPLPEKRMPAPKYASEPEVPQIGRASCRERSDNTVDTR